MNQVTITAVKQGDHVTIPARDGTEGYVGCDAECDGLHFSLGGNDAPCFFVPAQVLYVKLGELPAAPADLPAASPAAPPAPPPEPERPSPMALWMQASRKPKRYEALLVKHGYVLPPSTVKRALIAPKPKKKAKKRR